jgi:peptidoglycan-associated lipoprotein
MQLRLIALAAGLLMLTACSNRDAAPVYPGGPDGPGGIGGPGGVSSAPLSGPGSQQDLAATAGDRVYFAYDQSDISPEGQQILERQAQWLRRYPNLSVTIEGHADERGTREYNLSLGERRAQAVKNVLAALGVPASRLSTISYGKERPEIPHSDEQSYLAEPFASAVVAISTQRAWTVRDCLAPLTMTRGLHVTDCRKRLLHRPACGVFSGRDRE